MAPFLILLVSGAVAVTPPPARPARTIRPVAGGFALKAARLLKGQPRAIRLGSHVHLDEVLGASRAREPGA